MGHRQQSVVRRWQPLGCAAIAMDAWQRLAVGLPPCAIVAREQQRAVNVVAGDWAAAASESVG